MVSAELPDPINQPEAYETVTRCLVHGPCGTVNPNAPCMEDGKCTKRYPRQCNEQTCADNNGYPEYRRRENGHVFVDAKGNFIDNRWVVPHNLYLVCKYNTHINVEVSASSAYVIVTYDSCL